MTLSGLRRCPIGEFEHDRLPRAGSVPDHFEPAVSEPIDHQHLDRADRQPNVQNGRHVGAGKGGLVRNPDHVAVIGVNANAVSDLEPSSPSVSQARRRAAPANCSAARFAVPFPGMGNQKRFNSELVQIIPKLPRLKAD